MCLLSPQRVGTAQAPRRGLARVHLVVGERGAMGSQKLGERPCKPLLAHARAIAADVVVIGARVRRASGFVRRCSRVVDRGGWSALRVRLVDGPDRPPTAVGRLRVREEPLDHL